MLICRKDIERIINLMDRFGMTEDWDGVKLNYRDHAGGYDLSVNFTTIIHNVICDINVDVAENMFGEDD